MSFGRLFRVGSAGFQVGEEALDFGVAVEAIEFFGDVVSEKLDLGGGGGFGVGDAFFHAIESGAFGVVADGHLGLGGFVESDAAAMARQQDFALGLGFIEFLFELDEGAFQGFHLRFLVVHLFVETLREALGGLEAVESGAGEIVLASCPRRFRLCASSPCRRLPVRAVFFPGCADRRWRRRPAF